MSLPVEKLLGKDENQRDEVRTTLLEDFTELFLGELWSNKDDYEAIKF